MTAAVTDSNFLSVVADYLEEQDSELAERVRRIANRPRRVMAFNERAYTFAVVGPHGGVHFWRDPRNAEGWLCGVEFHKPAKEGRFCWLLGQPCEHDGSTTFARETYLPMFKECNETGDFEPLWRSLEMLYESEFVEQQL